ncbi:unnamed protein product [Parascedosporium putredinis]|uniref:Uncharacterized protein n=1 Tax=Parascedosporium putredinis TaxID=1442378 RepID=A0A9P1H1N6_9PEZI|nr:unnamed protein product [Parascedosporium putredinis]CAI7993218.1 unnamed protein product [Parascedosporium putredinis]
MWDAEAMTPKIFIVRRGKSHGRPGKLLNPARLMHAFVSPRKRARQTFDYLLGTGNSASSPIPAEKVTMIEQIAEWDYGNYEGMKAPENEALRAESKGTRCTEELERMERRVRG